MTRPSVISRRKALKIVNIIKNIIRNIINIKGSKVVPEGTPDCRGYEKKVFQK
jgi:hypothetical protein